MRLRFGNLGTGLLSATIALSCQIERELKRGRLKLILEGFEPRPIPVHIVYPEARLSAAKTRAFVDFATPRPQKGIGANQRADR